MVGGLPYNEYGQLLAEGFDVALAIAFANDYPQSRIDAIILRYARNVDQSVIDQVTDLARQEVAAGEYINGLGPDDEIDLDQIPINPYLFGDEPAGRRVFTSTEFNVNGGPQGYRMDLELPDLTTKSAIEAAAKDEATGYVNTSPKAFEDYNAGEETEFTVNFGMAVRIF